MTFLQDKIIIWPRFIYTMCKISIQTYFCFKVLFFLIELLQSCVEPSMWSKYWTCGNFIWSSHWTWLYCMHYTVLISGFGWGILTQLLNSICTSIIYTCNEPCYHILARQLHCAIVCAQINTNKLALCTNSRGMASDACDWDTVNLDSPMNLMSILSICHKGVFVHMALAKLEAFYLHWFLVWLIDKRLFRIYYKAWLWNDWTMFCLLMSLILSCLKSTNSEQLDSFCWSGAVWCRLFILQWNKLYSLYTSLSLALRSAFMWYLCWTHLSHLVTIWPYHMPTLGIEIRLQRWEWYHWSTDANKIIFFIVSQTGPFYNL